MKGKGHQGEHGGVYNFGAYTQMTTPCAPIPVLSRSCHYLMRPLRYKWLISLCPFIHDQSLIKSHTKNLYCILLYLLRSCIIPINTVPLEYKSCKYISTILMLFPVQVRHNKSSLLITRYRLQCPEDSWLVFLWWCDFTLETNQQSL